MIGCFLHKFIVEKGTVPQKKSSTKEKHFTLMGLTALSGEPVMCVVIFAGESRNLEMEMGVDMFVDAVGEVSDKMFYKNNMGKGKLFPGGPTCVFRGVEVPCFCRYSSNGSINTTILKEILETLDVKNIYTNERAKGKTPFILLDGHGSRFGHDFLSYMTDKKHPWTICIGVPYGTASWQVGDSTEQNGMYKLYSSKYKDKLMKHKLKQVPISCLCLLCVAI